MLYERALREVEFDFAFIWDDMAFKNGPLIGPELFREFMLPYCREMTGYFRSFGVKLCIVDSDGSIDRLIPCFTGGGINGVLALEVAAGMDVRAVREAYPELSLLGGVDKRALAARTQAIDEELDRRLRGVVGRGRYLASVDHHLPPAVSLANFGYYLNRSRQIYQEALVRP